MHCLVGSDNPVIDPKLQENLKELLQEKEEAEEIKTALKIKEKDIEEIKKTLEQKDEPEGMKQLRK